MKMKIRYMHTLDGMPANCMLAGADYFIRPVARGEKIELHNSFKAIQRQRAKYFEAVPKMKKHDRWRYGYMKVAVRS